MKLYRVDVIHYGPKDRHEAIEAYLLAEDEGAVFRWLDDKADWTERAEWGEGPFEYDADGSWIRHPETRQRAEALGIEIVEYEYGAEGRSADYIAMVMWRRGDFETATDTYYGVTQYHWDAGREVSDAEAVVLERCGVAEVVL